MKRTRSEGSAERTSIPVHVQVVLLAKFAQLAVQAEDDLLVRATLERNTLALVVEAKVEEERDGDALPGFAAAGARLDDASDDRCGIQCGCLAVAERVSSRCTPETTEEPT